MCLAAVPSIDHLLLTQETLLFSVYEPFQPRQGVRSFCASCGVCAALRGCNGLLSWVPVITARPWMHLLWSYILAASATVVFSRHVGELFVSDAGLFAHELTSGQSQQYARLCTMSLVGTR
jgi:hypothetical protein